MDNDLQVSHWYTGEWCKCPCGSDAPIATDGRSLYRHCPKCETSVRLADVKTNLKKQGTRR